MLRNIKAKIYAVLVYIGSLAATVTSAAVGTAGINSLGFLIQLGSDLVVDADNYLTITFLESDELAGTYAAAPPEAYYPDMVVINDAALAGKIVCAEYRGNAPFVKCVLTKTGTTAGTGAISAVSLDPEVKPSNLI